MDFLAMLNEATNDVTVQSIEQSAVVNGNYLDNGEHDCRIEAVDTTDLKDKYQFHVVWKDASARTHRDRVRLFINDRATGKPKLCPDFARLLVGVFGQAERVAAVLSVLKSSEFAAILALTGMNARITLKNGSGWVPVTRDGKHYAKDVASGTEVAGPCDTMDALKDVCARSTPRKWRSFREVASYVATHAEENNVAWDKALDELNRRVVAAQSGPPKFKSPQEVTDAPAPF